MAWESLQRGTTSCGTCGIKFYRRVEKKGGLKTAIRLSADALHALGAKQGDYCEVLFDFEAKKIGFQKSTLPGAGFRLTGKYKACSLSFATPKNRNASLLLPLYGRNCDFVTEGKIVVVKVEK